MPVKSRPPMPPAMPAVNFSEEYAGELAYWRERTASAMQRARASKAEPGASEEAEPVKEEHEPGEPAFVALPLHAKAQPQKRPLTPQEPADPPPGRRREWW